MSIKYRKLTAAIIVAVGALVWMGLDRHVGTNDADTEQSLSGTKLKLVGKHGPLLIYIDTTSPRIALHPIQFSPNRNRGQF